MSIGLKISEGDHFPGQVTSLAHIGTANKIVKDKLTPKQLEMFRRTVFGRFVDIDLVFNSPLVHHMLLREVKAQRGNAMSFFIKATVVTFSKEEFLLMTGLWRAPTRVVRNEKASEELERKYFSNRSGSDPFHINVLEEEYKQLEFQNDDDAVKITLVYYTEVAMMGKNKQKSAVDRELFKAVEDLEYYNDMDWGNIIWERTLEGLQTALKDKVGVYKKKVKSNKDFVVKYSLRGFPQAFQIWTYETLSSVVGLVATQRSKVVVPRILRWSCSHSVPFRVLQKDIFESSKTVVNSMLVISDAEKQYQETSIDKRPVYDVDDDGDDDDHGAKNEDDNDTNEDGDGFDDDHGLNGVDSNVPTYDPNVEHINHSNTSHIREEEHKLNPLGASSCEEEHLEPSNLSQREGVNRANAQPDIYSYLQSIDSSISRLEGRVSTVEEDLGHVKLQLATITSLLQTLCKGTSTVDVDEHTTPTTTISPTSPLAPVSTRSPSHPVALTATRSSPLPLAPTATRSPSPPTPSTTSLLATPLAPMTTRSPTPLAPIETIDVPPTETLTLAIFQTPPAHPKFHTSTPSVETHISTPPVKTYIPTSPISIPIVETLLEPLPFAHFEPTNAPTQLEMNVYTQSSRDPSVLTVPAPTGRGDRKRKGVQSYTPTTTQVEKKLKWEQTKVQPKLKGE